MSSTCASCDASVDVGDRYCTVCGAAVNSADSSGATVDPPRVMPPAAIPAPPYDGVDMFTDINPAYPRSGSSRRAGVLAVAGVVAVLLAAGFAVWFRSGRPAILPSPALPTTPITSEPFDPGTPGPPDTATTTPATTSGPTITGSADGLVTVDPQVAQGASGGVVASVVEVFDTYFAGVNGGRLPSAYGAYSARERAANPYPKWSRDVSQSQNESVSVLALSGSVEEVGTGNVIARVSFRSRQPAEQGAHGEACTDWILAYTLVPGGDGYLIDGSKPASGKGFSIC
jgi:hypothetical protein